MPPTRARSSSQVVYGLPGPQLWTVNASDLQDAHQFARQFLPNPVVKPVPLSTALYLQSFCIFLLFQPPTCERSTTDFTLNVALRYRDGFLGHNIETHPSADHCACAAPTLRAHYVQGLDSCRSAAIVAFVWFSLSTAVLVIDQHILITLYPCPESMLVTLRLLETTREFSLLTFHFPLLIKTETLWEQLKK